jgi:hypothetical protein
MNGFFKARRIYKGAQNPKNYGKKLLRVEVFNNTGWSTKYFMSAQWVDHCYGNDYGSARQRKNVLKEIAKRENAEIVKISGISEDTAWGLPGQLGEPFTGDLDCLQFVEPEKGTITTICEGNFF